VSKVLAMSPGGSISAIFVVTSGKEKKKKPQGNCESEITKMKISIY